MRLPQRLAWALTFLLLVAGCGGAPSAPPAPSPSTATAVPASAASAPEPARVDVPVLGESRPQRLTIPALGVDTAMMNLGLQDDGTMEVPPDGTTAGWYDESPTPGELGPAVLAAHVDWQGERGVFHRLAEMEPGDEVRVSRADGSTAVFAATRVERYPKDDFPSQAVYGDVDGPELRLITCGGDFDAGAGSYRDNIVVYAEMVGVA